MRVNIGEPGEGVDSKTDVDVQLDPWDTWSIDHTLSYVLVPLLIQLRDTQMGAPKVANEDVPEELWDETDTWSTTGETDPHWFDRWNYVLSEMIFAMSAIRDDNEHELFKDYRAQVYRDYIARVQQGCVLFGKYFQNLWD
jgi:hypothetical protein